MPEYNEKSSTRATRYLNKTLTKSLVGLAATVLFLMPTGCSSIRNIQRDINDYRVREKLERLEHIKFCEKNPIDPSCLMNEGDGEEHDGPDGPGEGIGGGEEGGVGYNNPLMNKILIAKLNYHLTK